MKLELTEKEAELLASALLFTSTGDVCIDLKKEDEKVLVDIAKRVGVKSISTAYIYGEPPYETPKITNSILKDFNIRRE